MCDDDVTLPSPRSPSASAAAASAAANAPANNPTLASRFASTVKGASASVMPFFSSPLNKKEATRNGRGQNQLSNNNTDNNNNNNNAEDLSSDGYGSSRDGSSRDGSGNGFDDFTSAHHHQHEAVKVEGSAGWGGSASAGSAGACEEHEHLQDIGGKKKPSPRTPTKDSSCVPPGKSAAKKTYNLSCRFEGCEEICDKAYTARSRVCLKHMQARSAQRPEVLLFSFCFHSFFLGRFLLRGSGATCPTHARALQGNLGF